MGRLAGFLVALAAAMGGGSPALGVHAADARGVALTQRTVHPCPAGVDPAYEPYHQTISVDMAGQFTFGGRTIRGEARVDLNQPCAGGAPGGWTTGTIRGYGNPNSLFGYCEFVSQSEDELVAGPSAKLLDHTAAFDCRARIVDYMGKVWPRSLFRFVVHTHGEETPYVWNQPPLCYRPEPLLSEPCGQIYYVTEAVGVYARR